MSGSRVLLDTNIIIALFARDASVEGHLLQTEEVFIPVMAMGELYYGCRHSGRVAENTARLDEFAESNTVVFADLDTCREYGRLKNALRLEGTPIPENDLWIAALASQHGLRLVTRDVHFRHVPHLEVTRW